MIKLFDYQKDAINRLNTGSILCGGVGSGKSITALAYYFFKEGGKLDPYEYMNDTPRDLYIITTARKRDTLEWEGELAKLLMSSFPENNAYNNKIVIDSWNNIQKYTDVSDSFFIFDEQRVIGYGAWTKAFLKITKANDWILLSATPGDTWNDYLPVFIANGFFKNKTQFNAEHVVFSRFTKYPKIDRYINVGKLIRLRNRILVDMDFNRQTRSHHEYVVCEYDKNAYKHIFRDRWNPYKNEPISQASDLCMVLRKLVNSDVSRQIALLDLVADHPRCIIFYSFDYELDILKSLEYINDGDALDIAEWNGHKHQPIPDSDKWIYLVQYTAGAEGWNCIKTDTIIFFSATYSYKVMEQASGRINRLNTPYTDLYYYHLTSKSPIDISINRAIDNKKRFNERKFANF